MARDTPAPRIRAHNDEMRAMVQAARRARGLSFNQASIQIGVDLGTFLEWLNGPALVYPKTARRIAKWLGVSSEKADAWEASARAYKAWIRWGDDHSSRSVTCAVIGCGVTRHVKLAQLRRIKRQWTCSPTCRALLHIMPGPDAGIASQVVFEAIRKAGSVKAFAREYGLSADTIHRLCRHAQHAPSKVTIDRLAARMGPAIRGLFTTRAEDRWRTALKQLQQKYPKGSPGRKSIGERSGRTRRGRHYPALRAAQRATALRKMEDPAYRAALLARLRAGQKTLSWLAKRLLLVHLRARGGHSRAMVFRSPRSVAPEEIPQQQLRQWAMADERRHQLPGGYLVQVWRSLLGFGSKGGRPPLLERFQTVKTLREQGDSWADVAGKVSAQEGRHIDQEVLRVWFQQTPLRRSAKAIQA